MSQAQLDRGYRLVELLKQGLNSPMAVQEQVVVIFAGTNGFLDPVPVEDVTRFEAELVEWFRTRHGDLLDTIVSDGKIPDEDAFTAQIQEFADQFEISEHLRVEPSTHETIEGHVEVVDEPTTLPEVEIERDEA